ncbi:MAG TPA: GAF domain-containing protein, partial [Chloroflexota bacterium]
MAADRNRIDRASTHHDRGEAVYRAALAIANELSLDAVLQKIVDAARELVNTRYAALGVVDEERRKLTKFVVSGVTGREIGAIEHWPYGLGLLGELIHFPHPLRIKDISKDPRSIGFPPNHPPMTSFLGVPLIRGERVLGNFYMTDKIGAEEFTEDDEELLSLFAVHAAIAIENARLYTETDIRLKEKVVEVERAESRARFLSDLGALLLRVPPGGELPLESIAEQATEPLADAVGMILVDPLDADRIVSEVIFHRIPERAEAATGLLHGAMDAVKDAVIRGGRPVLLTNASRPAGAPLFDQAAMESARFSAVVAVPVATRQTAYGALFSLASRPLSLTEDDLKFALLIADRLGSALD